MALRGALDLAGGALPQLQAVILHSQQLFEAHHKILSDLPSLTARMRLTQAVMELLRKRILLAQRSSSTKQARDAEELVGLSPEALSTICNEFETLLSESQSALELLQQYQDSYIIPLKYIFAGVACRRLETCVHGMERVTNYVHSVLSLRSTLHDGGEEGDEWPSPNKQQHKPRHRRASTGSPMSAEVQVNFEFSAISNCLSCARVAIIPNRLLLPPSAIV